MVISSCQIIGFIVGFTTLPADLYTAISTDWRHNVPNVDDYHEDKIKFFGLWQKCYSTVQDYYVCQYMTEPFFTLSSVIQGCRILVIMSAVSSIIGTVAIVFGMDCTVVMSNRQTKARIARLAAVFYALSGILIGSAASWYAVDMKETSKTKLKSRYQYGVALIVAWSAMTIGIIGALFIILGSCDKVVTPRSSTPSSSISSRAFVASNNSKSRPVTPVKRTLQKTNKQGEYSSIVVANGSAGGYQKTMLSGSVQARTNLFRQSSTASAPTKLTTVNEVNSAQSRKTYV